MPRLRATRLTAIASAVRRLTVSVFDGAAAAYSTRIPAGSTYSGPLLRVRRSSDNAEQDIGSTAPDGNGNRWIDTSALLTFCGSGSGFVTKWYDQSGNGRDASQATAATQPRIVNAGVVDVLGGVPTIRFLGSSGLLTSAFSSGVSQFLANAVVRNDSIVTGYGRFVSAAATADINDFLTQTSAIPILMLNSTTIIGGYRANNPLASQSFLQGSSGIISSWWDAANHNLSINGASPSTAIFSAKNLGANIQLFLGFDKSQSGILNGAISEVTWFHSVIPSAARQALERNQGTAFGITVA